MSNDKSVAVFFSGDVKDLNDKVGQAKSLLGSFGDQIKSVLGKFDTSALTGSFKDAGTSAEASGEQASSAFDKVKHTIEGVTLGLSALAVAGTAYLLKTGADAVALADQLKTTAGAFDQTVQSMGALKSVADRSGLTLDALGKSFFDLQSKAASGDDGVVAALAAIGLKAQDVAHLTQDALAVKMADAFSKAKDSSNKAAAGVALFGSETAGKLIPQLDQGVARIKDLEDAANRAGTIIGPALMAQIAGTDHQFQVMKDSLRELLSTIDGMKLSSFASMKGAIDGVIQAFTDVIRNITSVVEFIGQLNGAAQKNVQATGLMTDAANWFAVAMVKATIYIEELAVRGAQHLQSMGLAFTGLSAVATGFGNDLKAMASTSAAALYTSFEQAIRGIVVLFGDLASAGKSALSFDLSGIRAGFAQFGADAEAMGSKVKAALASTYFANTTKAFAATKAEAIAEGVALDKVLAKLEAQKAAQLALIAAGGTKAPATGTKAVGNPAAPDKNDGGQDGANAAIAAIDGEIQLARKALAQKEEIYAADVRLKIMSESQKLASTQTALDAEYAAEKALLNKELQIDNLSAEQKQQALNKLKQLDQKYANETQKIMDQAAEKIAEPWFKMIDNMSSSVSSGIMGILEHTKTMRDVFKSIAQSITQDFIKMGVDVVANWAKAQVGQLALTIANETSKTSAVAAGTAARQGLTTAGLAAESGAFFAHIIAEIGAMAAQAFAGVTAFLAPVMGPAAVGPAAGVEAAVLAVGAGIGGSYAMGSWQLPSDMLAQVPAGEMIVPAAQTPWIQSLAANAAGSPGSGGGGGDTHVHLHLNAIDAQSGVGFIKKNGRQIAEAIGDAMRLNPSTRGKY